MKPLKKFLNTKSQWHPLTSLPKKPQTDAVKDYLIHNGFDELNVDMSDIYWLQDIIDKISKISKEKNKPMFYIDKDPEIPYISIRFWKGQQINQKNPIVYIRTTDDGHEVPYIEGQGPNYALETPRLIRFKEYKCWKDAVIDINKIFGW